MVSTVIAMSFFQLHIYFFFFFPNLLSTINTLDIVLSSSIGIETIHIISMVWPSQLFTEILYSRNRSYVVHAPHFRWQDFDSLRLSFIHTSTFCSNPHILWSRLSEDDHLMELQPKWSSTICEIGVTSMYCSNASSVYSPRLPGLNSDEKSSSQTLDLKYTPIYNFPFKYSTSPS